MYHLHQNSTLSSHPVVGLSELRSLCTNLCPDERTFCLVLLQLQKEKRLTVLEQNGDKVQSKGDRLREMLLSCMLRLTDEQ